jgi:quercetin dioxygenase-like cupin family protein
MQPPEVRRVVTGHDAEGRSVISIDEVAKGERFTLIWTTDRSPADNMDEVDGSKREVGLAIKDGTVFRVGQLDPGDHSAMHRTNSVDYGIVLEGELDMEMDGGEVVHLKAGDVVVQRGTNHAWINNSDAPCKMAWILIDAEPVRIGDKVLEPTQMPQSRGN